mmetsp:Transcript_8985/g.13811  ORF Transcript_8985/g.13811 Transcript_8985/m.13811 type:complete len:81 (-) Transcript_8985:16-258(-)
MMFDQFEDAVVVAIRVGRLNREDALRPTMRAMVEARPIMVGGKIVSRLLFVCSCEKEKYSVRIQLISAGSFLGEIYVGDE